uniref:Uncharacterized protein n=1 Tax=Chaetoceros debilis TaxID=122233 RepID=A0A7S3Q092_9STRA
MVNAKLFIGALVASSASAFAPVPVSRSAVAPLNARVDAIGNNIAVQNLLIQVEETKLLSKIAQSGLLSKAQASGVTLTQLEPLIKLAASNKDAMIILEAAAPEALPILPKIVDLTPAALPLLAAAIQIPPVALQGAAVVSLAAAAAGVFVIPDDTTVQVAAQTLLVGVGGVAAAASAVGSVVLSKIKA